MNVADRGWDGNESRMKCPEVCDTCTITTCKAEVKLSVTEIILLGFMGFLFLLSNEDKITLWPLCLNVKG